MDMPVSPQHKLKTLEARLLSLPAVAIAFSGGLDSRFLTYTALRMGLDVLAIHVRGPHIPSEESAEASDWATQHGARLTTLRLDPLDSPALRENGPERCYHCKHAVFTALLQAAKGLPLCDGTNYSDLSMYRPGLRALNELGIISPLAQAEISKAEIRILARETGMDRPEQAARPCLLTRFNYGVRPTHAALSALDAAENAVARVLHAHEATARADFRLRFTAQDAPELHIAVAALEPALRQELTDTLARHGFSAVPIVLVEQVSGHFDRAMRAEG